MLWRLGGRKSDFHMGPGTAFAWQHDARMHPPGNLLSLFDDGGAPTVQPQSKALVAAPRRGAACARLSTAATFTIRPRSRARSAACRCFRTGTCSSVGATSPYFSEHTDGGRLVFDAAMPDGGENYRVLRFPWRGTPYYPPGDRRDTVRGRATCCT